MSDIDIPQFVAPFLWSYDIKRLNTETNKKVIIHNVLNFGSEEATDWLRGIYSNSEIQEVLRIVPASEWSKKSIALWSLVFGVSPAQATRFI